MTEDKKAYQKRYRDNPQNKAKQRLYQEGTKDKIRSNHLLRKFDLTQAEYDDMLTGQDNCCAICLRPFTETACVDHDHTTGNVRGLLCQACNRMLGQSGDNPQILRSGAEYLEGVKK